MYAIRKSGTIIQHSRIHPCDIGITKQVPEQSVGLNSDRLERLLHGMLSGYGRSLIVGDGISSELTNDFRSAIDQFVASGSKRMAVASTVAFEATGPRKEKLLRISTAVSDELNRFGHLIQWHDRKFQTQVALRKSENYGQFLFLSEQGDTTCEQCNSHHGELFTAEEISHQRLQPPLHPNCTCHLVRLDNAGLDWYNEDEATLIDALQEALDELESTGGIFSFDSNADALSRIDLPARSFISERGISGDTWDERLFKWATGHYTMAAISSLFEAGSDFFDNRIEQSEGKPLLWFLYTINSYTFGQTAQQ